VFSLPVSFPYFSTVVHFPFSLSLPILVQSLE
jgi:hypothetical protein